MIFSKLDNLSNRDKIYITIAVVALIALAVDHFVVRQVVDSAKKTQILIDSELKELAYNHNVIACTESVKEDFSTISEKLGKITSQDSDIDIMKGEIDDLARKSGLLLTSMKNREPKKWLYYTEYIVDIGGFEGDEGSLLKFLDSLQHNEIPGLLRVVHLNVRVGRQPKIIKGSMTITKVMIMRESDA